MVDPRISIWFALRKLRPTTLQPVGRSGIRVLVRVLFRTLPEKTRFRSESWRSVDKIDDPATFVADLDRNADTLRETRLNLIRLLEVRTGSSVLDVGSGTGEFLIEVARMQKVRAVGVDSSEVMVKTASERAAAAGVDVHFVVGDAQRLEFPDDSFDSVNCSLVLLHLVDPVKAVSEMARVLAPGGRVAISEPDHDSFMIDSDDLTVARAIRGQIVAATRNPAMGRRLSRVVADSGLQVLDVSGTAIRIPIPTQGVALDQFRIFERLDDAVSAGEVDAKAAARWRLEVSEPSSRISIYAVFFRAVATKPLR